MALLGLGLLVGCGYRLVGAPPGTSEKAPGAPNGVPSIAISVFTNHSKEPELEQRLSVAVRRAFLNDGRLRLASAKVADSLLEGSILSYHLQPLAFDALDNVTQYRLRMTLDAIHRRRKSKQIIQRQQISAVQEYTLPANISARETSRQRALAVAFRQLAQQLMEIVLEGYY